MPASNHRVRTLFWLIAVLVVSFCGLQLASPELTNPPVTAELQAPPHIRKILRDSCYNCHSNETRLWWFDKIVPAYWLVARDVKEGRKYLNFSEIGSQPPAKQKGMLFEAINQIQLGAMPLPSYRKVHPESAISAEQLTALRAYLAPPTRSVPAAQADVTAADTQYAQWIGDGRKASSVAPAPNGFEFIPDYKNWKAISSTERFDNGTMRLILGNDVAIKAIAEQHINPWPDGTAFAKVAWLQQADGLGSIRTGAFQQVEFMERDSKKYAATKGWGWGRWRGTDLKPYGTSAAFTDECVGCHTPMRDNDYVYTMPFRGQQ